jgi:hypothetical protein
VHHKRWQIENHLVVSFEAFEVFVRTLPGDSILEDSRRSSHQARQEHKEHKVFSSPEKKRRDKPLPGLSLLTVTAK